MCPGNIFDHGRFIFFNDEPENIYAAMIATCEEKNQRRKSKEQYYFSDAKYFRTLCCPGSGKLIKVNKKGTAIQLRPQRCSVYRIVKTIIGNVRVLKQIKNPESKVTIHYRGNPRPLNIGVMKKIGWRIFVRNIIYECIAIPFVIT